MSEVTSGYISRFSSLRDGTLRIQVDIQPADSRDALNSWCIVDGMVAITGLNMQRERVRGEFSDHAMSLYRDGYFRRLDVVTGAGTDKEYLSWLRTQECLCKNPDHDGSIVAAHVRRVGRGAGTGIKPAYSAIPLCHHHHQMQHQYGESEVPVRGGDWEKASTKVLESWVAEVIKNEMGYESLKDMPPAVLKEWENRHGIIG